MSPRVGSYGISRKARGGWAADQARPALLLVLAAALPACSGRMADLDPRPALANIFGAHLEGREPPPGLDRPWPKLSDVPARPAIPDPALRDRISASLADDRQQSRAPLTPGAVPLAPVPAGEAPPAPPRLAAAPAVRWEPSADARALPAALPAPAPAQGARPASPAAEAAPFAPPPAPSRDLLAPPPAPSSDLLAPRRD